MGKNVIINQDKLIMLKETLDEFMVDKNSNVANHNYVWFILYRGDLLLFDYENRNLLDDFFYRHQDELSDFVYLYEKNKYKSGMNFDAFVDMLGSSVPYLISGYISNGNEVYVNKNENYDILNSNELFQFMKKMPNSKFYFDGRELNRNDILSSKGKKMPTIWYHGTTFEDALNILGSGLRAKPEKSLYKIKHDKTVFMTSNFRQAKWYANYKSRMSYGSWANKPCVLKIDGSKIDSNKIVYDYDVYNAHTTNKDDSVYNDRMSELGLTYNNVSKTILKPTDPRKYMKVGYRGIIMPSAVISVFLVTYGNDTEMSNKEFIKHINDTYMDLNRGDLKLLEAAPEVDEYEIGSESNNPPIGGNGYHINEGTNFNSSEIGGVNYSWDFDEDDYQEWLEEAEYENTQESLMEYISDNVTFELEYLDNETYHSCGYDYVTYEDLETMFGTRMQNEILKTCMNNGSGSFETTDLYSSDDVDVNNYDSVNNAAMEILRHGEYFKDCRGFILTNGVVVYTESEHNEICRIPNINSKFDFIRMGNIRVLPQSIDIGAVPTSEQRNVLRKVIASYANEELYLDIYQGKSSIGARYVRPEYGFVIGEIDRFFSEGIKPQGNGYYESKNRKKQIVENKYDDLFNKASYNLQYFMNQCKEKYGTDGWYITQWMKRVHPDIEVNPKDIEIYTALSNKLRDISKLWNEENNKEENEEHLEQPTEEYDVISLAVDEYGLTDNLNQAGYILPDGKLLNFGSNGQRDEDHRQIALIYKQNGIKIWNDEYRYNYVVDFMNHGAIRCDAYSGILDMTKEPTNSQFYVIKEFVRNAVDIDIDFTDSKGNTLHSVSYSNANPQAVVADISRYYEEGIKPTGNVQYESKNIKRIIKEDSEIYSSEFKKWFGDWENADKNNFWYEEGISKVVDDNLMPKIVKHGTPNMFKTFDLSKAGSSTDSGWLGTGFYFYGDNDYEASHYARNGRVMSCYLNIKNPYIASYKDKERLSKINTKEASDEFREELIEDGYDGVFYNDDLDEEWVAFYPEQIREVHSFSLNENIDFEVNSSDIDLSSFKKQKSLNPKIWNDNETLNSKVRLRLLDIADDFWNFVNLTWVKPKGIIITGSICNYNWSHYSDIDLHLIVDFKEVDDKTDFVRDYLDSKKNDWNTTHNGLKIYDFPIELYTQDINDELDASGVYDLKENKWVTKPRENSIKPIGLNKYEIKDKAAEVMTIIDDMYNALNATDDSHKIETIGDDAQYLWKKVKAMRKDSLRKNGESGAGNIVYKILRRTQYLDKLFRLFSIVYDRNNSIIESVESNNNVDVFALAKERFGITNDIRECGYILPDGSMLDFSGRHMVTGNTDTSHLRGRRGVDHRDIGDLNWDADMTTKSGLNINMSDFIRMGAIRIHCSNTWSSINLFKKPTREQVNPMLRLIQYSKGNVTVEIGDGNNSYEYAEWDEANSRRVVNDIIRYFDGETINLVGNVTESTDDSIYAIEESKTVNSQLLNEYLEKDNNLPLYKYFKWASTASSCEKARDLAYSCSYYIGEYIREIYYRYSEFEDLLNDGEFDYEDESLVEMFLNMLEENKLCDHFISVMQDIVDYYELPSWCIMDFNRIVKNEWCIHFCSDSENIAREGFTSGTEDIGHLAYTNAGVQKSSAGYDFAFSINDRSTDYSEYGDEAVIFRTSGVEIFHYGDNQNQVIFWGPNVKSFIPIHQDNGDWVVYGQNGQVLVRCGRPSEIAIWATENLPQYRKQIMTGKNGYIPMQRKYDPNTYKVSRVPYPLYRNESIDEFIRVLKKSSLNEEWVADGNSSHNPYAKRWKAERQALKNFLCNYGKLMQSKENGKIYKCYYDKTLSQLIGYNYVICIQYNMATNTPRSTLYIRAMDKFSPTIRQVPNDMRGRDNQQGTKV